MHIPKKSRKTDQKVGGTPHGQPDRILANIINVTFLALQMCHVCALSKNCDIKGRNPESLEKSVVKKIDRTSW